MSAQAGGVNEEALRQLILDLAEKDAGRIRENFKVMDEADFKDLAGEAWWYNALTYLENKFEDRFEELQRSIDFLRLDREYKERFLLRLKERIEKDRKAPDTGLS